MWERGGVYVGDRGGGVLGLFMGCGFMFGVWFGWFLFFGVWGGVSVGLVIRSRGRSVGFFVL